MDEHIKGSGISLKVARDRGYKTILGRKELEQLGFSKAQRRTPGLLIPVHTPDGKQPFSQYRPDHPRQNAQGKDVKYETPTGVGMRIDVSPRCRESLRDPSVRLWITEGIKKADALASHGECVMDLLGVWSFKGKNEFGGVTLLTDLDYIAWDNREVYLVFDSDIMTKPQVRLALDRLTEHLKRKGAKIHHVYLPQRDDKKVGVDDYLLEHTIDELMLHAREPANLPQIPNEKQQKRHAVTFVHDGDWLVEMIKNGDDISFIVFHTKTGEVVKTSQVQLEDGTILTPPEENLIRRRIIHLPTSFVEYKDENLLFEDLKTFINGYVELGDFLETVCLYVLLSWLYDKFTEVPYLRFMGDYGTGKSRALMVIGSICYKPFFTFGASTVSPIFRLLDAFRGTMILDEGDHKDSSMWNEMVKILNTGFQSNIPLLRTEGDKKREVKAYHVFGPKLIATRRPFHDDALESRCLTKIMPPGARRKDIPINLPKQFHKEVEDLRNKLLCFRLKNYLTLEIDESVYIPGLEDRLNQVLSPLLSMAKGEFRERLGEFCTRLQEKILEIRSQSLEGMTIKALIDLHGKEEITVKRVSEKLTELGFELSPHKAGRIIRSLEIDTKRSTKLPGSPFIVLIEKDKLLRLSERYGIPKESYENYGSYNNELFQGVKQP